MANVIAVTIKDKQLSQNSWFRLMPASSGAVSVMVFMFPP
jgi:hypothetical protein